MRHLLVLAALATACDQGATAAPAPPAAPGPLELVPPPPPPPVVRFTIQGDDDFVDKAVVAIDEMLRLLADGTTDCAQVATRIETWVAQNVTRLGVLTDYAKAHPDVQTPLLQKLTPRLNQVAQKFTRSMTACSGDERVTRAFSRFEQYGQRPR